MSTTTAFPVSITEAAVQQIQRLHAKKDKNSVLRLGVKGGGCSGLSYVMRFDEAAGEADQQQLFGGVAVVVDPKSARFLEGAVLDYSVKNLLDGGWKWSNPNAGQSCGCGTSFNPK